MAELSLGNLQTQVNSKANTSHTHTKANITDFAHTHDISQITGTITVSDANTLDGYHASNLQLYQSLRDFTLGTLIKTDIDYSQSSGNPWLLEIEGNSYSMGVPFDIKVQGYIYADTIINFGGISNGTNISGLVAFNLNGYLCFWYPRQNYWQGFSVFVNGSYEGIKINRLISITNEAKPTNITKEVAINTIKQSAFTDGWIQGAYNVPTSDVGGNIWIG